MRTLLIAVTALLATLASSAPTRHPPDVPFQDLVRLAHEDDKRPGSAEWQQVNAHRLAQAVNESTKSCASRNIRASVPVSRFVLEVESAGTVAWVRVDPETGFGACMAGEFAQRRFGSFEGKPRHLLLELSTQLR